MASLSAIAIASITIVLSSAALDEFLGDKFIASINNDQKLWKAGTNFDKSTNISYLKGLMGTYIDESEEDDLQYRIDDTPSDWCCSSTLPEYFDAREHWPYCDSIREVRDQGSCGSCWAVVVASVMTDRVCTMTTRTETLYFSDEDIMTCCVDCLRYKSSVCAGGSVERAWAFARSRGVVSGGPYRTTGGCKAYSFKPCDHTFSNRPWSYRRVNCEREPRKKKCVQECTTNRDISYKEDMKRFSNVYRIRNEQEALCEIYNYGPILAIMSVYIDFINYKEGIYEKTNINNVHIGNHSVKIVGWGVDKVSQTKYWIAANTWNSEWGDKGFFKIARGINHCRIEEFMSAGKL